MTSITKISLLPITTEEGEQGVIALEPHIQEMVKGYDANESWKITQSRAGRIAVEISKAKISHVCLDLPNTFQLHLKKQLGNFPRVSVVMLETA